jgi:alpha-ribazole phosphatase
MTLTLLRHGDVDEKYHGCYNGHNKITLSQQGVAQSKKISFALQHKNFDAIYCSDLPRATQTLQQLNLSQKVVYTKLLREKSWGRHEGMTFDNIISTEEFKYENFLQWINALDGEEYSFYIRRIELFFLRYLPLLKKKNILIVTHAGVIRVLLSLLNNLTLEEAFSIEIKCATFIDVKI